MARGWRNYDAAPRPGPQYQGEAEFVHGRRFTPRKRSRWLKKQSVRDTRKKLPQ